MRERKAILEQLAKLRGEAAGQAALQHPGVLAAQAGANAPLIAQSLGSLVEVALDIREAASYLISIDERMSQQVKLLDLLYEASSRTELAPEEEEIGLVEPANEVDAEHLKGIFPPCPACGSERVNGAINDETGRYRECQACGHDWWLDEVEEPASGGKDD